MTIFRFIVLTSFFSLIVAYPSKLGCNPISGQIMGSNVVANSKSVVTITNAAGQEITSTYVAGETLSYASSVPSYVEFLLDVTSGATIITSGSKCNLQRIVNIKQGDILTPATGGVFTVQVLMLQTIFSFLPISSTRLVFRRFHSSFTLNPMAKCQRIPCR